MARIITGGDKKGRPKIKGQKMQKMHSSQKNKKNKMKERKGRELVPLMLGSYLTH
jgi:hypothetical protein